MSDDRELLACPFCGGAAHFFKITDLDNKNFGGEGICCGSCPITTDLMFSLMDDCKPLLAEKWNRRAPHLEAAAVTEKRCHLCDCTGDIHSIDGEWRGECPYCKPAAVPEQVTRDAIAAQQAAYERARDCPEPELSREDVVRLALPFAVFDEFGKGADDRVLDHIHAVVASLVRSVPVGEVKPVAWQEAPIRTVWGSGMMVADIALSKDATLSLYADKDDLHFVPAALAKLATPPTPPAGWRMVPVELLRQLRHYTICHLMVYPECGAPTEQEIDAMLAAAPQPGDKA